MSCGTKHGSKYWLNTEICGLICGSVTWILLIYGMYAFTLCVVKPWLGLNTFWGLLHTILFNTFSIIAIYSHIMAMITDPGAVPKNAFPLQDDTQEMSILESGGNNGNNNNSLPKFKKFCKKCDSFKPARAHHCSICMRCIVKMDHHCPWVNNCVGIGNHKFFILFIFWTNVVCSYSLIMVLSMYSACIFRYGKCVTDANENILGVLLLVESILFGLFTLCMIADQGSSISSNQTQIDRLKNMRHESPAHLLEINEVFGTPSNISFEWKWLLPVVVKFPDNLKDKILGYQVKSINKIHEIRDNDDNVLESNPLISKIELTESRDSDLNDDKKDNEIGGLTTSQSSSITIRKRTS